MAGRMVKLVAETELNDPGRDTEKGLPFSGAIPGSEERRGEPGSLLREGCVIMADDRNVDVIEEGKKAHRSPWSDL